ncbi:MAG: XRE family transcriptional regulator [Alicyclobacillus sp.]|nr:XRE family transcriptional regulator [Alicyclobacillus sp.]
MEREQLSAEIGRRLRYHRQQRQMSLDALSELTGVSKPMLGQIERGVSNPTVATLWRIASGLKVPFTALIGANPALELLRASEQTRVSEDGGRFEVFSTYAAQGIPFEIYRVRLHPGCSRSAEPHGVGVTESVTVFTGVLTLSVGEETFTLAAGDALSFAADVEHRYGNTEESVCELSMVIFYPAGGHGLV